MEFKTNKEKKKLKRSEITSKKLAINNKIEQKNEGHREANIRKSKKQI